MWVYATGVFLQAQQFPDGKCRWVATKFEEDTFMGSGMVNPACESSTKEGLVSCFADDEEEAASQK